MIPYGRQTIDKRDIKAVVSVLKSSYITQGPMVERFEEAFAAYCGAPYAVAVSSGTAGLHLASLAAGFGPGDEVLTSPLTFVASSNSVLYCGATPKFVDVDKASLGINPKLLKESLSKKTAGVVTVDFAGQPCVIGSKNSLSKRPDFFVIEDACHALGSEVRRNSIWKKVGGCAESDMTVFSFHPVKHITTGEGGMITTRRKDFYEKLRLLRSHGIEKNPKKLSNKIEAKNPWYYEMVSLGFNYRITDIQCALGLSQLKKLDSFVNKRREIAAYYQKSLCGISGLQVPEEIQGRLPSYHLYVLQIDFRALQTTRQAVMSELKQRGIGTQVHYVPVTRHPYYQKTLGCKASDYPVCESFYEKALSIPIFPSMTRADARKVVAELKRICLVPPCP